MPRRAELSVLITSVSQKVPLVAAVRAAHQRLGLAGKIVGADSAADAIGRYFVDQFWQMPQLEALSVAELIDFCLKNRIGAIIPTRDGELAFFAKQRNALKKKGISVMVSSLEAVQTCRDKYQFFRSLHEMGFPAIPAALKLEDVPAKRYVVKDRFGAGAKCMGVDLDRKQARAIAAQLKDPIYEPFYPGDEYSIDVYVALTGEVKGCVVRNRDKVVNGESQITTSLRHPELETLCGKMAEKLGLYGHAVFQAICERGKVMGVIECNPRFGGASTLSLACGLNSFEWFLREVLEDPLPAMRRKKNALRQVRYPIDLILPAEGA